VPRLVEASQFSSRQRLKRLYRRQAELAAFRSARNDLGGWIAANASGRELAGWGFTDDIRRAAAHDVSHTVPNLVDGAFR